MRVEFSPLAEMDLEAIADYIAQDSPLDAVRFIDGMRGQCERLARAPLAYVARPELGAGLRRVEASQALRQGGRKFTPATAYDRRAD